MTHQSQVSLHQMVSLGGLRRAIRRVAAGKSDADVIMDLEEHFPTSRPDDIKTLLDVAKGSVATAKVLSTLPHDERLDPAIVPQLPQ